MAFLLGSGAYGAQSYSANRIIWLPGQGGTFISPNLRGPIGDWNSDGTADFAVAYFGTASTPGVLRVVSGFNFGVLQQWVGQAVLVTPPSTTWETPGFGLGVLSLNGDPLPDLLIGIPQSALGGAPFVGRVRAVLGPTGAEQYTVWGQNPGDGFGARIDVVGDTTGDGVSEYTVYAPSVDVGGQPNLGAMYLIEGSAGSVLYSFLGSYSNEFAGPVEGLGDIDGDGAADFAVSSPSANGGVGKVSLYSGGAIPAVIREHVGTQAGWFFGNGALIRVPDADNDGVDEYVISSLAWNGGIIPSGPIAPGEAWLYSGATGSLLTTYQGPTGTGWLGLSGDRIDDLDGDGISEILLSAPNGPASAGFPTPGELFLFSGWTGQILATIPNPIVPGQGQLFGAELSTLGDIDGDGRSDFGVKTVYALCIFTHDIVTASPSPAPLGSTVTFSFSVPAQPGATYHLCFSLSAATGTPVGTRIFPLDPDWLLLASLQNPFLGGVLDPTGSGAVTVQVPASPALVGLTLSYAGLTLSPTSPFGLGTIGSPKSISVQ